MVIFIFVALAIVFSSHSIIALDTCLHVKSSSTHITTGFTADPLTMEERALASAARQALLQQTARQPVPAAILWLTCAHLAAYNTLPSQVIHR